MIVDLYTDTLVYSDAFMVAALCGLVGFCKYEMKARHQIDDIFLSQNITETNNTLFCSRIAAVLTLPLIWQAFEKSFLFYQVI